MLAGADRRFAWLGEDRRPLDWNGPADRPYVPFRAQDLNRPIVELLEDTVQRHRGRIAIRDGDTALTFGELWEGLSGLSERLRAETRPGDLIGILQPAGPLFPVAMLACLASGRPFVAIDTHHPPGSLDQLLRDARPSVVITSGHAVEGHDACAALTRVIPLTRLPEAASTSWRPTRMDLDEPACVLFTSGSSGRPKSIVNSQRNLLQRVAQSTNAAHVNADDRFLTLASPSTIVGVRDTLTALLAGASIHLLDPAGLSARDILSAIRSEAITILFAFPALLRAVVTGSAAPAGPSLRLVRIGGDTTLWSDVDLLRAWLPTGAAIQSIYAATEAPMLQWFVDDAWRSDDARVPIGYPLPGNRLAIIDEEERPTAPGEVGELVVASPYVSLGQWIAGRCVPGRVEPGGAGVGRMFRTGDLVRQRPNGLLERVGRKDRQVKIRGTRVDLDGVEAALRRHSSVQDVAALARTSAADGTMTLVAYVSAGGEATSGLIEELKALMRSVLPAMRPACFYLVHEIPRLPSSKLDVRALMALDDANVRRQGAQPADDSPLLAGDRTAQAVAQAWTKVLLVPVCGPEDDFFDSGGDSLKAIAFLVELERALGLELSPVLINEAPTFGQLCNVLRNGLAPGHVPLVTLKAGQDLPPLFFIHGVGGNVAAILPTARRVTYRGPVIGIRARGLARGEAPHWSVGAMAADYLGQIKARQPAGPYYLCGYSFGGIVAFEIARQLIGSGDEVAFVGLFDTLMSPIRWPLKAWPSIAGRRIARLATAVRNTPLREWPATLRRAGRLTVTASAFLASAKYRPGFYPGQLTLFTPVERENCLPSLETFWRTHAGSIAVVETAGNHATMLAAPHADSTAACLTLCLP